MHDFNSVIKAVSIAIQTRTPVLLKGEPGVAKTRIVEALFSVLCDEYDTKIAALYEPPEFGGYPVPKEGGVAMMPPEWVLRLGRAQRLGGLFLDELSSAPPATRAAALRGVQDGKWGDAVIPHLACVAAMNPPEIAESGYDLSAPLANRFCHLDWVMPTQYWIEANVAGFPAPTRAVATLPDNWEKIGVPKARAMVVGFASARPHAIQQMPADPAARAGAWPSFRTWTMGQTLLGACLSVGESLDSDATLILLSGCVGTAAAQEFLVYARDLDLPDPEVVLKDPSRLRLPERGDRAFAVLSGVVSAVLANNTAERWGAAWAVLAKAVEDGKPDIAAGAARALANNRPKKGNVVPPESINAFIPLLKVAGLMSR